MLTDSEIAVIDPLFPPAKARVDDLASRSGIWDWLVASADRQAYVAARDLYQGAETQYQTSRASPDDQHEEALQIVQALRDIATPGWAEASTSTVQGTVQAATAKAGETIRGWINRAAEAVGLGGIATWVKIGIVVVGLLALAYVTGILAPLLPRRRRA